MRDTSLDIHCARCGGAKGCPGIYHPAERAKLEALFQQKLEEKNREIIILRSDLARAIGYCQGLGHPDKYLEKRYPELLGDRK